MYVRLHVKYPLFLTDFNKTCFFSTVVPRPAVPCEKSDRHDELNGSLSQFYEGF